MCSGIPLNRAKGFFRQNLQNYPNERDAGLLLLGGPPSDMAQDSAALVVGVAETFLDRMAESEHS